MCTVSTVLSVYTPVSIYDTLMHRCLCSNVLLTAVDFFAGIISLSSIRQPDLAPFYRLNITATDGVYIAFCEVNIRVTSANKHTPVFQQAKYEVGEQNTKSSSS